MECYLPFVLFTTEQYLFTLWLELAPISDQTLIYLIADRLCGAKEIA